MKAYTCAPPGDWDLPDTIRLSDKPEFRQITAFHTYDYYPVEMPNDDFLYDLQVEQWSDYQMGGAIMPLDEFERLKEFNKIFFLEDNNDDS